VVVKADNGSVRIVQPVPLQDFADLMKAASRIQDAKRASIYGRPSQWPDGLEKEFATLEARGSSNPYIRLDLEYLRERSPSNRSFAYVVTYDTFVAPPRDDAGHPRGEPELFSVVKLGDGGRADGRSAGTASGSIICRTIRSYWAEPNVYRAVLRGVTIPGNDRNISAKVVKHLHGWDARVGGDVWHADLLDKLSVDDLLQMMDPEASGR
jgi:hypothetical protein